MKERRQRKRTEGRAGWGGKEGDREMMMTMRESVAPLMRMLMHALRIYIHTETKGEVYIYIYMHVCMYIRPLVGKTGKGKENSHSSSTSSTCATRGERTRCEAKLLEKRGTAQQPRSRYTRTSFLFVCPPLLVSLPFLAHSPPLGTPCRLHLERLRPSSAVLDRHTIRGSFTR